VETQADAKQDFMKLEYQAVLQKISATRADLSRTETIYPLAMAAVYGWLFSNAASLAWVWRIAIWIPFGIAVLALVRILARQQAMKVLEGYCRELEKAFYGDAGPGGWENTYYARKKPMHFFAWVRFVVGIFLIAASVWVANQSGPRPTAATSITATGRK